MTGSRRHDTKAGWVALVGILALSGALGLLTPAAATAAQAPSSDQIATLEAARGQVSIIRLGRSQPAGARPTPLQRDDIVVTKRGRATVRFLSDGTVMRVGPDSRVQINESATDRDITVFFGRLWAHVVRFRERTSRFRSASTIAAIRGTEVTLDVAVDGDETRVAVLEGNVETETDAGTRTLTGGQVVSGRKGAAPAISVGVRPKDAVQWALYYVPVLNVQPGELGGGQPWQGSVEASIEAYWKGDLAQAVESVEGVAAEGIRDPGFFTYRASLYLATGSVTEAEQDLAQAERLAPNNSDVFALQSIVAVANNRTDEAARVADRAVNADPNSATARVARSYARQALFDIEGARENLEKAVELDPNDALAWARLAEIRSSLGRLGESLEAAQKAVDLEPNLSRTQTVLGFAYLTRVQTRQAKEAFDKAIALDEDDPLPRLGHGLALIREGDLTEGVKELEVAVSLDPGGALVRSYLGKGYFEQKRTGLDEREYDVAQQADPNDPTPWLYDAIAQQTTNRPVEALQSNEEAIELNDNRAVYRSRLLLDSDLAARSASLGRIYSDLGFQNLALVEGWTSVNIDPGNFSAHRLLADSYAALPRHEIARVSELFQSQMLQPLNTTAIQPRLGESNLFLIASGGPGSLSFNEFNPLFNRDQLRFQGSFLAGEDNTLTGEGIVSGIYKKLSFSAGYSAFETDGFRENGDQKDQIANVFAQIEISPSTSIQAEYRYRDNERGDLRLRFFEDDYFRGERRNEDRHTARVGARHDFSPGSTLLASFAYVDTQIGLTDDQAGQFVDLFEAERLEDGYGAEVQHLFRSDYVSLTTGFGYFDVNGMVDTRIELSPIIVPPPFNVIEETLTTDLKHINAYAYSYINPVDEVTAILGVSGDFLEGESPDVGEDDQLNPKMGLIWKPLPGTTLRGSAFKTLRRTLVGDQTLEPTQVAGFNQFFDDNPGTRAWRYGGALDQKIGRAVFAGVEYSQRDLEVPFLQFSEDGSESELMREDAEERLARVYLFTAPHDWLAVRAEYLYERLETQGSLDLPTELKTHRVPLGLSFFHPSGFSASVTATYFDQRGDFVRISGEPVTGSDDFWTVDAAVSYRLPKRYGFIAVGATNLFNEEFNFFDIDTRNPIIQPTRRVFARVTLAF